MTDCLTEFINNDLNQFETDFNKKIDTMMKQIDKLAEKYTDVLENSNLSFYEGKDYRKDIAALNYLKSDLNNVISTYNTIITH